MRHSCLISATVLGLAAVSTTPAADLVRMRSGVRMEVERVEPDGDGLWLYTSSGNMRRVAASDVASFEPIKPPGEQAPKHSPSAAMRQQVALRSTQADPTRKMIDEAAWRHGLPPAIVHAVAQAESAYNQKAVSSAGAIGVMQLMPYTAAALGANPRDKAQNIDAGTRYLRDMLIKFQTHPDQVALALAAYNAGPGAVDRYRGVPPYSETQTYVRRVIGKYQKMAGAEPEPQAVAAPARPDESALAAAAAVANVPLPRVDRPTVNGLD